MPHLDLSDDEAGALVKLLTRTIDGDRYPLSPRLQILKTMLAKLRPEPVREPPAPAAEDVYTAAGHRSHKAP